MKDNVPTAFDSRLFISMAAPSEVLIRRAGRLLAMVHELHKIGYQHLRISPGYSLEGTEWRCYLFAADNIQPDGWTPNSIRKAHLYKSTDATKYFGWSDAEKDDARNLAAKFLNRFPETARAAAGQDWAYAGWFTSVLGWAENGHLPTFYGGLNYEHNIPPTPFPPRMLESDSEFLSNTGYPLISHEALALADLPPANANYELLWPFCLSFDGYRVACLLGVDCECIANQTLQSDLEKATMEELRMTAFIRQRAIKWSDRWPPDEILLRNIRDVVEEVRRRLTYRENNRLY